MMDGVFFVDLFVYYASSSECTFLDRLCMVKLVVYNVINVVDVGLKHHGLRFFAIIILYLFMLNYSFQLHYKLFHSV